MLAFVRVFAFYIGTALLLTWGLFALGWADALEMDGFSNAPVVEPAPRRPQTVAVAPVPEPVPKSALPREVRAPVPEPVLPPPAVKVEPAPVVVAPTPPPPPMPPVKVAVVPQAERALPVEAQRQPEPVKVAPVLPAPALPNATPPAPPRQVDLAPSPQLPQVPAAPAARPAPPPPPAASRGPETPRMTRWAPARRVAGFGHDALIDHLDDPRRTPDDVPCIVMRELTFKAGSSQFAPRTQGDLQTVAKVLALFPGQSIEIGSRLGPGRPMASDAKLRADRTRTVRDALIRLGVAGNRLMLEPGEGYERVVEDVNRVGVPRVQSIGLCVRTA